MTLDKDVFKELKCSILMNGLLQPIAVRVAGALAAGVDRRDPPSASATASATAR